MVGRFLLKTLFYAVSFAAFIFILSQAQICKSQMVFPAFQKGMTYITWNKESFATPKSDESIRLMSEAGINCVAIVPTWYQEKFNSTTITANDRTPSDSSLKHAIRKAHENGMSVMLKPHIDLIQEDCNRSDIGFQKEEDWKEWFSNYKKFITHYAKIAKEENVEFFCVGTELTFAATKTDGWKNSIIPAVREIYKGQITYAANWDEYSSVQFWSELDYAGIDAYFPLSKKPNPTVEEIKEAWKPWLNEIESWQKKIEKPVIFTEAGYCSADTASAKPWEEIRSGTPNPDIQAKCYKAVFETFWDKPWFFGVYWWNWNTYPGSGGNNHKGYTPQNKIALDYVKTWYCQKIEKNFPTDTIELSTLRNTELEDRLKLQDTKESTRYTEKRKGISSNNEMAGNKKGTEKCLTTIRF